MPIIAFTGYKQSGKDTAANYLVREHSYKKIAFADPIREICEKLNPIVGDMVLDYHLGSYGVQANIYQVRYNVAVDYFGYDKAKNRYPEMRRILQKIGTEVGREMFDENIWVDWALSRMKRGDNIAVSDLRFKNEEEAIRSMGGWIIRLVREDLDSDHPSETEIQNIDADWTIINEYAKSTLYSKIDDFLRELENDTILDFLREQ